MKKVAIFIFGLIVLTSAQSAPVAAEVDKTNTNPVYRACIDMPAAQRLESAACNEVMNSDGSPKDVSNNPLFGSNGLLNKITRGIALVAGSIAVIFMIIGGYKMILSNNDKQAFTNGRNTLIYAVVGLVVITMAQAIVSFVITRIN